MQSLSPYPADSAEPARALRIALLTELYPPDPGGVAASVARLAHGLAGAGHSVTVYAPGAATARRVERPGLTVERFARVKRVDDTLADWYGRVAAAHAHTPFDVLHAYYAVQAGFVAVYAGRVLGVPSVVSARGNDLDRAVFDPAKAAHTLYALQYADALTTNARDLANKARALAPGRAVALTPNGVDSAHFTPGAPDAHLRTALGLDGRAVLGFAGEARAKKGLGTLLLTARAVAAVRPVTLLLVGGARPGADSELVEVFCKQNPDVPVVRVPYQAYADLPAYYRLMDVFVLPAVREGLPNALLEALACGRAAVATPVGGIPDVLTHGVTGCVVPVGDAEACAAAVLGLLADDAERARLGAAGRAHVQENFTFAQELHANLQVYARLLAGRAGPHTRALDASAPHAK